MFNLVRKFSQIAAQIFLGGWFMLCAIDGWAYLLFDYHMAVITGFIYLDYLIQATYFWAWLKFIQLLGALSLLLNFRPALGLALTLPITSVMSLFYFFELQDYTVVGVLLLLASVILLDKYRYAFLPLLRRPPKRAEPAAEPLALTEPSV